MIFEWFKDIKGLAGYLRVLAFLTVTELYLGVFNDSKGT